ncbi:MAG: type II toxin-antitoxin system prevent-host-death family antitoxin [Planctomycetes bacterium]|nr:type II toxin-antitoxin system prevent-host-death family antitoxin [Planctomycetota bacterium]
MHEFKKHLSAVMAEVAAGARVLITRHKRPVAQLASADLEHVHVGAKFGRAQIRPLFRAKTRGRYLEILDDDRREGGEGR